MFYAFFVIAAVQSSLGQDTNDNQKKQPNKMDNNYNNYNYQYDSESYDYGKPKEYQCYSCTYHVRQGSAAGLDNCRDPFVETGIPMVPCIGHCAVSQTIYVFIYFISHL